MRQGYICNYCKKFFESEMETIEHEKACSRNPENKVDDKTIHRTAMLLHDICDVISCCLSDLGDERIEFLLSEIQRADECNCFCYIYQSKYKIDAILSGALHCKSSRKPIKTTKYEETKSCYPELFEAIKKTLDRPSSNEH